MADLMTFPDTVEEFMGQYKVVDTEGIYMSKGAELVPIFRMKQWFDHKPDRKTGKWIIHEGACEPDYLECSRCKWITEYYGGLEEEWNHCPMCGSYMRGNDHETD